MANSPMPEMRIMSSPNPLKSLRSRSDRIGTSGPRIHRQEEHAQPRLHLAFAVQRDDASYIRN